MEKKHLQYSHKKYELKSLTGQAASYCLYTKVKLKIDISSLYSVFFLFIFNKGICPLFFSFLSTPLFLLPQILLKCTRFLSSPVDGAESASFQSLGSCAYVLSRVRWRRGWSRIWLKQPCLTVNGTHCCARGCPAGCYCCPHYHWVVPVNCLAPCLLAPGTAVRSYRARSGGARDLLTLMRRRMLRLLLPLPCCNAGAGGGNRGRRVQLLGSTGFRCFVCFNDLKHATIIKS